jgi:hypothetical protein
VPGAHGVRVELVQAPPADLRGAPALHGEVVAGHRDGPAPDQPVAADLAVARRGRGVLGPGRVREGAHLLEAAGVEQPVDVLADRALAARVQALDALGPAHLRAQLLAPPAQLVNRVGHAASLRSARWRSS